MRSTDIRIRHIDLEFSEIDFRTPLQLSSGPIHVVTYAKASVEVMDRRGRVGRGVGAILLSDLWAFPSATLSHEVRDTAMRRVATALARDLPSDDYMDPLEWGERGESALKETLQRTAGALNLTAIPFLAGVVCFSPIDAAIHDAWGRLVGQDLYTMYTSDYLNRDLGDYLGESLRGKYPGEFLSRGSDALAVQHAVGGSDHLWADEERETDPQDGIPNTLQRWIESDRVHWLKLKATGKDLEWDLARIVDVFDLATDTLAKVGVDKEPLLEIDPNEGCSDPAYLVELLARLRERSPAAFDALRYIEQPTGRDLAAYDFTLHDVSRVKPVIVDESLETLSNLELLDSLGFSGVALKTCKGQTHTLLAYCWARAKGCFITVQDLTNPGLAFVHSAELARRLHLSVPCIEFNSRQFIPHSCPEERAGREALFKVEDGSISFAPKGPGLY